MPTSKETLSSVIVYEDLSNVTVTSKGVIYCECQDIEERNHQGHDIFYLHIITLEIAKEELVLHINENMNNKHQLLT